MITTPVELDDALDRIADQGGVGSLDLETTAFIPSAGEVRLIQICGPDEKVFVIDCWAVGEKLELPDHRRGFHEIADWFDDPAFMWIAFNNQFELSWFHAAGADPLIRDAGHLHRAIYGGGRFALANLVKTHLGIDMDKEHQASDWSAPVLSPEQLSYAADDALYTWQAWWKMRRSASEGALRAFLMLDNMTPAVMEMQAQGLLLDRERHAEIVSKWQVMLEEREELIRELIDEAEVPNLNSGKQLSNFFSALVPDELLEVWPRTEKTKLLSTANKDLIEVAGVVAGTPLAEALRLLAERSTLVKYLSSFGDNLITLSSMSHDDRIHANYRIGAAITGRFSSSGPNLQQQPRDKDFFGERLSVRRSFIAAPGRLMASLDYSGIELRVLALLSGDPQLLEDMITGDVHLEVGQFMAGRPLDKSVTEDKEIRQSAKAVSFGIVYGTSAGGLAGRTGWTFDRAQGLIDFWADRYPLAFGYRNIMREQAQQSGFITMVDGGTIKVGVSASPTRLANYPVQRAALSVMAYAIIRHHDSLCDYREEHGPVCTLNSTIHDALIDEADEDHAERVLRLMHRDMVAGYLDVFPGAPTDRLVEGGVGPSWGELEDVEL